MFGLVGERMPFSARRGTRFKNDQPVDQEDILYQEPLEQDQFTDQFMFQDYGDPYEADGYDQGYYGEPYGDEDGQDPFVYQPDYYPASAYSSDEYEEEYRQTGVLSFIAAHWRPYLIAILVAIALGAGAAVVVGIYGTTPDKETAAQSETDQTPDETEIDSEASAVSNEDVNTAG